MREDENGGGGIDQGLGLDAGAERRRFAIFLVDVQRIVVAGQARIDDHVGFGDGARRAFELGADFPIFPVQSSHRASSFYLAADWPTAPLLRSAAILSADS